MNKKEKINLLLSKQLGRKEIFSLVDSSQSYVDSIIKQYPKETKIKEKRWTFILKNLKTILTLIALIEFVFIFFPQTPHNVLEEMNLEKREVANISISFNKEVCEKEFLEAINYKECEIVTLTLSAPNENTVSIRNLRFFFGSPDYPAASIIVSEKISSRGEFTATLPKFAAITNLTKPGTVIYNSNPFNKETIKIHSNNSILALISEYPGIRIAADNLNPGDYLKFKVYVLPGVNSFSPPFKILKNLSREYAISYSYEYSEDTYTQQVSAGGLDVGADRLTVPQQWYQELSAHW